MTIEVFDKIQLLFENYGYFLVFFGCLIESSPFGWLTPGNYLLATAGFFTTASSLSFTKLILAGTLGTWSMLITAYLFGKKTGNWLAQKLNQEKTAEKALTLLEKHGGPILTTSLMSNITRFWISYVAGTKNYNLKKFLLYSLGASLTWVSLWITIGFIAAGEKENLERNITRLGVLGWLFPVSAFLLIYLLNKKESKKIK